MPTKTRLFVSVIRTICLLLAISSAELSFAENPKVIIKTSRGDVVVKLYADEAPVTVVNFLSYVDEGEYDGVIFHRVIAGMMIQTGGYFLDLSEADEGDAILNEADNGLKNARGTLAMARMNEIDSASRQFFINTSDNTHLDHTEESCSRADERSRAEALNRGLYKPQSCKTFGYAVFGEVIAGMELVEEIELVDTESSSGFDDLPLEPITIKTIERVGLIDELTEVPG
jgi:cyclophilin family peptidyl-prolyl cis-trans isomerase